MVRTGSRRWSPGLRKFLAALLFLIVLAAATSAWWLAGLGNLLIRAEAPEKADIIVVLAGDWYGHRILKGGELVREGYAPRALVSGPNHLYGISEDKLAIPFAVRHGYPENYFEGFRMQVNSTREEAGVVMPELRRRGIKKAIVVTTNYHTRRAGRIFREAAQDVQIIMVAARDEWFRPDGWWQKREAQKIVLMEWTKTVASYFGM